MILIGFVVGVATGILGTALMFRDMNKRSANEYDADVGKYKPVHMEFYNYDIKSRYRKFLRLKGFIRKHI